MLEIDQIANALKDGERCEYARVLKFLAEYGFIEIHNGGRKGKLAFHYEISSKKPKLRETI